MLTARRVCPPCSGFAPDSLVQPNKNACLPFRSVAHLPQNKPDIYLHRRKPGGGFCFLDTAASAPAAVLREEKLFLGQSKQLTILLQIRARGLRGSGNTGLTILSSFFFLRLHAFLRPLPFPGFLLAVKISLAPGLLPDTSEFIRLVGMLRQGKPRLCHGQLPASEACLNGHAARNFPRPGRVSQLPGAPAEIIGKLLLRVPGVFPGEAVLRFFQSAYGHFADGRVINRISAWCRHDAPFLHFIINGNGRGSPKQ